MLKREIAPEKEEQRQAEQPQEMKAASHEIHPDLEDLVKTGVLRPTHTSFRPAFQSLELTTAARLIDLSTMPVDLLVTKDFERTIVKPSVSKDETYVADFFLRSVQYVISVMSTSRPGKVQNLVLISPHEANKLKSFIIGPHKVTLHTFMPRIHEIYPPLDRLTLYNVGRPFDASSLPTSLRMQLNLFSGSLYLNSYNEYEELCSFLGIAYSNDALDDDQLVCSDGFISPPASAWGLQTSPIPFLRTLLMRIRHEGEGLEKTHLGKILNGVRLEEADFTRDVEMVDVDSDDMDID